MNTFSRYCDVSMCSESTFCFKAGQKIKICNLIFCYSINPIFFPDTASLKSPAGLLGSVVLFHYAGLEAKSIKAHMENTRHSQLFVLHEIVPKYAKCISPRMENALKENKRTWKLRREYFDVFSLHNDIYST